MGLRSKPRVTILADPEEDDFDGVELVTFDSPRRTASNDASERGSSSALVVEPTAQSDRDDEPNDEPEPHHGPVLVASRRAGRRGVLLALLGLLTAATVGGAYLSHDRDPGSAVAAKPHARPTARSKADNHRLAARPRALMKQASRPRRHHHKPQRAHSRAVAVAPAPAPAPAPVASARPPVSAPAPHPASPSGGEFLIGGP